MHVWGLACQSRKGESPMTQEYEESRDVSLLAIDQYMRGLRWSERLTEEEEVHMIERVERGKRERTKERPNQWVMSLATHARDRLVEGYQSYVCVVARKLAFCCRGLEMLDLIQEGNIALMGAIESHDPTRGYPLHSLVGIRVRDAMRRALGEMNGTVRVCWRSRKALAQVLHASEELCVTLGREPSYPEVAARLGWTLERVVEVMDWRWYGQVQSLQGLLREGEAEDAHDFVGMFQASVTAEASRSGELEQAVRQAIETALTDRQREVVSARYGFGDGIAQEGSYLEIASQFQVNQSAVHKVDGVAKRRLQAVLAPIMDGSDWGIPA
jgi:RNA polymerase sigma factor (sigma-70 family)